MSEIFSTYFPNISRRHMTMTILQNVIMLMLELITISVHTKFEKSSFVSK